MNAIFSAYIAQVLAPVQLVLGDEGQTVQQRLIAAITAVSSDITGVPNYPAVAASRTNMRNEVLRLQLNASEQRLAMLEQKTDAANAVNDAQQAILLEMTSTNTTQSARLDELTTRLDLVRAATQNLATDLAANQAHDTLQDARLTAAESKQVADELAIAALQAHDVAQDAAQAANTAADQVTTTRLAATTATANAALAQAQVEHAANLAQQSQLDNLAAQLALQAARLTGDEQAIATAQATASQALQKANEDATAVAVALAAAQAAQTTATNAGTAAANAQTAATAAGSAAATAQTKADTAKLAADAAQAKADADAIASSNAQATATAAQQAAAANAATLVTVQAAVAGKLDAALVRRGTVNVAGATIAVNTSATTTVTFATPFADANYEVFLSKPGGGLLGVELGWQNKTATGFTLTERNTGLASLVITASTADYFAIHN